MSSTTMASTAALSLSSAPTALYSPRAWTAIAVVVAVFACLPAFNLLFPVGHALHVSSFAVALIGKFICYAMAALALDPAPADGDVVVVAEDAADEAGLSQASGEGVVGWLAGGGVG